MFKLSTSKERIVSSEYLEELLDVEKKYIKIRDGHKLSSVRLSIISDESLLVVWTDLTGIEHTNVLPLNKNINFETLVKIFAHE